MAQALYGKHKRCWFSRLSQWYFEMGKGRVVAGLFRHKSATSCLAYNEISGRRDFRISIEQIIYGVYYIVLSQMTSKLLRITC